jgi:hypothetical protein
MATELPQRGTMAGSPCYQQCCVKRLCSSGVATRHEFEMNRHVAKPLKFSMPAKPHDQINFYPRSLRQLNEI